MQAKLWKMTPPTRLPSNISCWGGIPSSIQITRFGLPKYAAKLSNPPLPEKIRSITEANKGGYFVAGDEELHQMTKKEAHSIYGDVQEFEKEIARERNSQTSRGLEEMSIPIQPRKYIGQHPILKQEHVSFILNYIELLVLTCIHCVDVSSQ